MALCLLVPTLAQSRSKLRHEQHRRLRRDAIKEVSLHRDAKTKQYWLHWRSPNGKVLRYRVLSFPTGLLVTINKLIKAGHKTLAIGGRYDLNAAAAGIVRPTFAYAIKRKWRGVRVVKLDGLMPLYTATVLPVTKGQPAVAYTLYGIVSSKLNKRDNKLICLYGTWFDLDAPQRPHRVSQSRGVKGRSLFFFAKTYRQPRKWRQLQDDVARRKAYFAEKRRKAKGLPAPKRVLRVPTLAAAKSSAYLTTCRKRLKPWELKFSSPPTKPASR